MALFKLLVTSKKPKQLDAFLLANGFSRKALNNLKNHAGMLLVNHRRRYTNYLVKAGDEVLVVTGKEKTNPYLKVSNKPLVIVKETPNYLIVNKPDGVLSIPSRYAEQDAVVNRLLGYFSKTKKTDLKPHIVTRLDKDTAGLVLVGKNAVAHARFSKIAKTEFIKKYHAIVHGNFAASELTGLIDAPIGRSSTAVKRSVQPDGKPAKTRYRVLKQVSGASLVELQLLTGRTHQIRVHMAYLGHPLYGDPLYGQPDEFSYQALNCFYLSFPDPFMAGQKTKITVADPEVLTALWQELTKKSS